VSKTCHIHGAHNVCVQNMPYTRSTQCVCPKHAINTEHTMCVSKTCHKHGAHNVCVQNMPYTRSTQCVCPKHAIYTEHTIQEGNRFFKFRPHKVSLPTAASKECARCKGSPPVCRNRKILH